MLRFARPIGYAIDRESMIRDLIRGQGAIAHSYFAGSIVGVRESPDLPIYPAKAKQLLDERAFAIRMVMGRRCVGEASALSSFRSSRRPRQYAGSFRTI